jgi:tetratricopeptide (TPR) repeat protein
MSRAGPAGSVLLVSGSPPARAAAPPWRRRHPRAARAMLYGLGLALAAGALLLLRERSELDREDRLRYLEARLESLPILLAGGAASRGILLEALEEEFLRPGVPPRLRARALRVVALAHQAAGAREACEAAFAEALALGPGGAERLALSVEWADARAAFGDPEGALRLLEEAPPAGPRDALLAVWSGMVRHHALLAAGRPAEAVAALEGALESVVPPPEAPPPAWLGARPIPWGTGLLEATSALVESAAPEAPAREAAPWVRLARLAPWDLDAVCAAAAALAERGHRREAEAAWAQARALDPGGASVRALGSPALRSLGAVGEGGPGGGLKSGASAGR